MGEPTFSIEKARRQKESGHTNVDGDHIELVERIKPDALAEASAKASGSHATEPSNYRDWERENGRKGSVSHGLDGLKKRIGSIRRSKKHDE